MLWPGLFDLSAAIPKLAGGSVKGFGKAQVVGVVVSLIWIEPIKFVMPYITLFNFLHGVGADDERGVVVVAAATAATEYGRKEFRLRGERVR